jgi:hypothetical protein
VAKPTSQQPELETLSRTQILIAMGLTAVLLLVVAKVWLRLDPTLEFFRFAVGAKFGSRDYGL